MKDVCVFTGNRNKSAIICSICKNIQNILSVTEYCEEMKDVRVLIGNLKVQ